MKNFLYLTLLMSSSSFWRVELSWLNSQSSWIASSWKYEQLNLSWVENVSNSTWSQFEFKMSIQNSNWWSVYIWIIIVKIYRLFDHVLICLFIIYFKINSILSTVIVDTQDLFESILCIMFESWVQISK